MIVTPGSLEIELDFYFDEAPKTLEEVSARIVEQLAALHISAEVSALNVTGPGGGNPNAIITFSTIKDAMKYLVHHTGSDKDAIDMCEFIKII